MSEPENAFTPERARAVRRKHEHERQAVIFGFLIAVLALAALLATAVYQGAIDPPFSRDFTTPAPDADGLLQPQPCLPEGVLPVPYSDIDVTVLNASSRSGLAATVGEALAQRGFTVSGKGNSTAALSVPQIAFGPSGLAAAYTLRAHLPRAVFALDTRIDDTLTLSVTEDFDGLVPDADLGLAPDAAMVSIEGCVAIEDVEPVPAPSGAQTSAPQVEEIPEGEGENESGATDGE